MISRRGRDVGQRQGDAGLLGRAECTGERKRVAGRSPLEDARRSRDRPRGRVVIQEIDRIGIGRADLLSFWMAAA